MEVIDSIMQMDVATGRCPGLFSVSVSVSICLSLPLFSERVGVYTEEDLIKRDRLVSETGNTVSL